MGLRGTCMILWLVACPPLLAETENCSPSLKAPVSEHLTDEDRFFSRAHLFQPLIADPKEPRFYIVYRNDERSTGKRHIGIIGFGETFPIYRLGWGCATNGWQLSIGGGGVARFDLEDDDEDMGDKDLIDSDYLVGLPLSWRKGNWSVRSRIYHESSHLGESAQNSAEMRERRKRSYDGFDVISSYAKVNWRLYGGAGYLLYHDPDIKEWGLQLGTEYYGSRSAVGNTGRWVAGLDVKAWEEYDFDVDISIKAGLSFGGKNTHQHHLQLMLEWYDGHANSGVFFEEPIRYVATGLYFGF